MKIIEFNFWGLRLNKNYTALEITVPEICKDLLNFIFWSALSSEYNFVKKL